MRRYLVFSAVVIAACHTDSATGPGGGGGGGGGGITDAKNMSVGEVRVLTPSLVPNGIELSANASASDYLVVVGNTSTALDVQANYVVKGDVLAVDGGRSTLSASKMISLGDAEPTAQEAADAHIRAYERSHLAPPRTAASASALRTSRSSFVINGSVTVGQQVQIKVPNEKTTDLCTNYINTTGTVKTISNKAIIVLDNQADQNAFTAADFSAIADEFDKIIYPTDSSYFGTPTDFDKNGKVVIYYTAEVNKLTAAGSSSFIGGFFFGGDFYDPNKTVSQGGCPQSNQGEIFYLLAPDPNHQFGVTQTTAAVRQGTRGTVAHEFQHMINAGNRFINPNVNAFESVWLDEGLAHTAEDAVGRASRGFGDFQPLSDAELFISGNTASVNDYNAFFAQNLNRFSHWLSRPDTSSGLSKHADENLSSRGAIWALLRWTGDQYSGGNFRAYTRKLAAGPDTGVKNLVAAAGQPLDTLLAGWLVANYSDHSGIPGLPAKYNYVGYNMKSAVAGVGNGTYPLQVTTLLAGATVSTKTLPGSGTYYKVTLPAGAGRTVIVQDPGGTTALFPGAHYYVLRID